MSVRPDFAKTASRNICEIEVEHRCSEPLDTARFPNSVAADQHVHVGWWIGVRIDREVDNWARFIYLSRQEVVEMKVRKNRIAVCKPVKPEPYILLSEIAHERFHHYRLVAILHEEGQVVRAITHSFEDAYPSCWRHRVQRFVVVVTLTEREEIFSKSTLGIKS